MELITAIFREERLPMVLAAIDALGYDGVTITSVRGHGRQRGVRQQWRGTQFTVDLLSKVKLELVVRQDQVDGMVDAISSQARTGSVGDGKIWVTPVSRMVRVRTGEEVRGVPELAKRGA